MPDHASTFAELTEGLAVGGSLVLLSDYDGSLTPIVGDPADARLSGEVRQDLRILSRSPRVRVGIVSGRALADVRRRVNVPGLVYAGCHGLEVAGRGIHYRHLVAERSRSALDAVVQALAAQAASVEGLLVEAKGLAVAVHYRHVDPEDVPLLEVQVERAVGHACAQSPGARLRVLRGNHVLEVIPDVAWGKGECALWIASRIGLELPRPVRMLYMGDDWTDEIAFRVLAGKAVTVRVGRRDDTTAAGYRLPDVSHVLRLLSALAEDVGDRSA
jgi:trehalose-phosphatase